MKGKSKFFIIAVLLLTIFSEPIIFAETENSIYIDLKLKRTPSVEDKIDVPDTIFLELGVITGKLYGSPLADTYWFIDMSEKKRPAIKIHERKKDKEKSKLRRGTREQRASDTSAATVIVAVTNESAFAHDSSVYTLTRRSRRRRPLCGEEGENSRIGKCASLL